MINDFVMIQRHFPRNDDLRIYFICDVHYGAQEHMDREWSDFCSNFMKDPNAYLILGGDLLNNGTKTSVTNVYRETVRPMQAKRDMAAMLKPLKSRILCAVSGNHERRNKDVDDDPMYDIMAKLDLEDIYRENMAFLKLQIGDVKGNGQRNPTYMLCVTHGAGGGALSGGVINRNERFSYTVEGMDVLLVGHSHKPMESYPGRIVMDGHNNRVYEKPTIVAVGTSWLRYGGYALRGMLRPSSHVRQTMTLSGKRKEIDVSTKVRM